MSDRLDVLEERVAALEAEVTRLRAPQERTRTAFAPPRSAAEHAAAWPAPVVASAPVPARWRPPRLDTESALKWGGVVLVVLAVGFLVSTAIRRGWIGPEAQLAGAVLLSAGLVGIGLRVRPTRPAWTHALVSAGVAAAVVTASSKLFRSELSDESGVVAVVVVTVAAIPLGRGIRSAWAVATAAASGIAGWLAIAGTPAGDLGFSPAAFAIWVATLGALTVAVAVEREWPIIRFAMLAAAFPLLLGTAAEVPDRGGGTVVLVVALIHGVALHVVPAVGSIPPAWRTGEIQLAMVPAPWIVGVLDLAGFVEGDRGVGWAALVCAVVAAATASVAWSRITRPHALSLYVGATIAFTIATAALLSAEATFVVIAALTLGLVVVDRAVGGDLRVEIEAAILGAMTGLWLTVVMADAWEQDAPVGHDVAHLLTLVLVGGAGWAAQRREVRSLTGIGSLALFLHWLGSALVHLPQGQALVSVTWALTGTTVLVTGVVRRRRTVAAVGLAALGFTVAKLLTVDLREVDALWRAALFLVIGVGFMRLGFLLPRLAGDRSGGIEDEVEGR